MYGDKMCIAWRNIENIFQTTFVPRSDAEIDVANANSIGEWAIKALYGVRGYRV